MNNICSTHQDREELIAPMRVMTIVGTRPEIIRLSRVIDRLDRSCDHILVHTGQSYDYELNEVFFEELEIRAPDYFLNSAEGSASAANTIGNVISSIDQVLSNEKPEAVLILGDTNSSLAAIAAKRRKIPIFHMEAGNRCFDLRVPEEINRRIVDHIADINLPYSSIARDYLLREGLPPDQIIKTGSPLFEVLNYYSPRIQSSKILQKLQLDRDAYFVVSAHREENIDSEKNLTKLIGVINTLACDYDVPVVVSTHPRTRQRIEDVKLPLNRQVQLLKPQGFLDYVHLQQNAKATLSDSGTITEESNILNFPALNLREAHERPEGFEEAAVMMVGLEVERVRQALAVLVDQPRGVKRSVSLVADYAMPNVSEKVVRIILSYTDYVNRVVWRKY